MTGVARITKLDFFLLNQLCFEQKLNHVPIDCYI